MEEAFNPVIGIIGGTGDLGSGLAKAWCASGRQVILGSRDPDRAAAIAAEIGGLAQGMGNVATAEASDIVILAVPYAVHEASLMEIREALQGKILVDAAVPLVPPKVSVVQLPEGGSAAKIAQSLLGEGVRVVSAFHNVGAKKLHMGGKIDCDVLVFSDDKEARNIVIELAGNVATRGLSGGALANSAAAEAMTSVLIWINRTYKVPGAGLRITGLETVES